MKFLKGSAITVLLMTIPLYACTANKETAAEHVHLKGDEVAFYERLEGKAPLFTLINQDGGLTSLSDLRGKVVVMTFIFTSCKYACPILETKLKAVQNEFKEKMGKGLALISITIDAEGDTPEVLKEHARMMDADPSGWIFLTGARPDIDRVLESYNIRYIKEQSTYSHTNKTIIIDSMGNLAYEIDGLHYPKEVLIERVKTLLGG
ncbi:MAG: SCO family protein [Deltaproteobacteria bacterium]|nr:SCO family protein [Deltaproteobacteria bacterium]